MKQTKSNALTQGAILAAVYILLFLTVAYVPLIGMIAFIFLPFPFIIHTLKFGLYPAVLLAGVTMLISFIFTPVAVFITLLASSAGLAMGYWYKKPGSSFAPIVAGMIAYIVNYLLILLISYTFLDINIVEMIRLLAEDYTVTLKEAAVDLQIPLDEKQLTLYKDIIDSVVYMIPAMLILSSVAMSFIHHLSGRFVLHRLGITLDQLPPFREWSLPKSILLYYLVTLSILLFQLAEEGGTLYVLVINLHPILEILLMVQGLTVIVYYAYMKKMNRALITLVIIFSILPLFNMIVRLIGMIEIGFGIRTRIKPKE